MEDLMKIIANKGLSDENDFSELNTTKEQIKLFLLAEARNNLIRIVKLTEFLNNVEDKFQEKVQTEIDKDSVSLEGYSQIIDTIATCLQRSSDIVSKVLNDNTLSNIVFIDNSNKSFVNNNNNNGNSEIHNILASTDSRDRVTKVVQKVIAMVDNNISEIEGEEKNE